MVVELVPLEGSCVLADEAERVAATELYSLLCPAAVEADVDEVVPAALLETVVPEPDER